jgi:DNA mismatch endonuclease Vsr
MKLQELSPLKAKPKKPAKKSPNKERISYTMSRVRSSGSAIERSLGQALWQAGLRYRKQYAIFGRPDFVLVKHRVAVFCDSEFWHGYRWGERRKAEHKSNQGYWFSKIERNRRRDQRVNEQLRKRGWIVIRFWEREILSNPHVCARRVAATVSTSK